MTDKFAFYNVHFRVSHSNLIVGIYCQKCENPCSINGQCGCLRVENSDNHEVCGYLKLNCSRLSRCETNRNNCAESDHICIYHSQCHSNPVCYPLAMTKYFCPSNTTNKPISVILNDDAAICSKATWSQNGTSVAGGHGAGSGFNQLNSPFGFFMDSNQTIYVADAKNNRIMKWLTNQTVGELVAGTGSRGDHDDEFNNPQDVFVDNNETIYVSDTMNGRVQIWLKGAKNGTTLIQNIDPIGIALDNQGSLYLTNWLKGELSKWYINGTIQDILLSNLSFPYMLFIDKNQSAYVSDTSNSSIIRIDGQTKNISIVAGGSPGGNLSQLSWPQGIFIDDVGNVYIADSHNHRIMRWAHGSTAVNVIVGGKGPGSDPDQLYNPSDLSFDSEGNLYVVDNGNHRVQKFTIDKTLC